MKVLLNIFRLVLFFGFGAIYTVWPVRLLTTLIYYYELVGFVLLEIQCLL